MKPTKQLIKALRETAARLRRADSGYLWSSGSRCNCGLLACSILGVEPDELRNKHGAIGAWTLKAELYDVLGTCSVSHLPWQQMFNILTDAGLEVDDFKKIEKLEGARRGKYLNPLYVARYFDAQADILEQRRANGEKP